MPCLAHSESTLSGYFLMYGVAVYNHVKINLLVSELPADLFLRSCAWLMLCDKSVIFLFTLESY